MHRERKWKRENNWPEPHRTPVNDRRTPATGRQTLIAGFPRLPDSSHRGWTGGEAKMFWCGRRSVVEPDRSWTFDGFGRWWVLIGATLGAALGAALGTVRRQGIEVSRR
ncbi:hypothetical protein ACLB2K_069086 [Fragaria x ananassa]